MPMTRFIVAFIVCAGFVTSGCSRSVVDLHESIDLYNLSFREKVAAQQDIADKFLACTKKPFTERSSEHADPAPPTKASAKDTDLLNPVRALVEGIKETHRSHGESLAVLEDALSDWFDRSGERIDLDKLQRVVDVVRRWHGHLDFDEDELSRDASRFAQLLLAYNKAYFGDITFSGEQTVSGKGIRVVTRVTSSGFTDRIGNTWVFPGLSVSVAEESEMPLRFAASPVESQRLSADLVRVFLEAFFDAAFQEPAVGGATALRIDWERGRMPYPPFDADHPPIPLEAFARVTRDALRAEAVTTSLVGKAVRGGSVFGTHNETVAATLETAAGVMAKKLVEHEGFCYYEVVGNTK